MKKVVNAAASAAELSRAGYYPAVLHWEGRAVWDAATLKDAKGERRVCRREVLEQFWVIRGWYPGLMEFTRQVLIDSDLYARASAAERKAHRTATRSAWPGERRKAA